ncbi:hypothetical protein [Streptomyces sp. NPDC005533]|uniref:hypothetical protein n=1 Tax=Streptomyces sp. NPDC005533 TaxID=3364723 RepID=UPI0036CCD102
MARSGLGLLRALRRPPPPGGTRGTIGGTYPFWQRHRYTRSQTFPRLHVVVLAGRAEHLLDPGLAAWRGEWTVLPLAHRRHSPNSGIGSAPTRVREEELT